MVLAIALAVLLLLLYIALCVYYAFLLIRYYHSKEIE